MSKGFNPRPLGRSGRLVGPLGVAASYGAPSEAFREAFEQGCNYFYWGSRRTQAMASAIKEICALGKRDELIIVIQSYSRSASLMEFFYKRALKTLGLDKADVLLLGWHNKHPCPRLKDRALAIKEKGLVDFLAVSGHQRRLFPLLAQDPDYDILHIRYNAAHPGAEKEVFPHLDSANRPGLVTYTATRQGALLNPKYMPPGETPPQANDCYRFVLSNPNVDVCMTGPADVNQMRHALQALDMGPLNQDEMERMYRIGQEVHAKGPKLSW